MKNKIPDLNKLHALHQKGDLKKAKTGYLRYLKDQPEQPQVLHALGLICAEQDNLEEASGYLKQAVEYAPDNPTFQLHWANILKMQGLFKQATTLLMATIVHHPHYAPAFNNLGTLHYAQGHLTKAIQAYQQALTLEPDYVDAYYNLGLALTKNNELAKAAECYQRLLKKAPEHSAARYQLACVYLQQDQAEAALPLFLELALTHPQHVETQINLASCYLKQGSLTEAKKYYAKALALDPRDMQVLYNLGYISSQQGHFDEATQYYQQLIQLNPDHFAAHYNLGVIFFSIKQLEPAHRHFQEASRLDPQNSALLHLIKIAKQDQQLLSSPPEYLKSLFDYYADHYEPHLLNVLDYKVPQLLFQAVERIHTDSTKPLAILDLGCGTGLCGEVFKNQAATLVGVDLSPKMLAIAAKKNIYDALICDDFIPYLSQQKNAFDLIIAGDVFVYIGDLATTLHAIKQALRPQGLLVFNTELSTQKDYLLNPSGRFSHKKSYLEKLAQQAGFELLACQTAITRIQNNQPVSGQIYILQAK